MSYLNMSPVEKRAAMTLASLFSLRMLGLFMILPVFSLYAETLEGALDTPVLIGLAIGIYGLTQALLQIPFGMLSDRFGRKPIITIGLLLFAAGSIVAAMSDTIVGVILGRALQGSGAIAAAVMAFAADLTREENRTKIMAIIGMSIGMSFAAALIMGPILNSYIGVQGIFWLTAVLSVVGIFVLHLGVPKIEYSVFHRDAEPVPGYFSSVLKNSQLLRLDVGIFTLHMVLTGIFVVMPFALRDYAGLATKDHWMMYLSVLFLSVVAMVPLVILAEKYRHIKKVFVGAVFVLGLALLGLVGVYQSFPGIFLMMLIFFTAFNVLEALLPSLVSKIAPADKKGTAMGVYSTSQFLGAFIGGVVGGWLFGNVGIPGVFAFCALACVCWGLWARTMQSPRFLSSYMIHIDNIDRLHKGELESKLMQVTGVAEVVLVPEERAAYLKVDSREVDYDSIDAFSMTDDAEQQHHGDGDGPGDQYKMSAQDRVIEDSR